jgi:hypothetical protein
MSFPHDPQLPQALAFGASGPHTHAMERNSRQSASNLAESETARRAAPLVCIECLRPWLAESERWRLKVTDELQPSTVPYCPDCATREFGAP